jgi:hypothetical protein
MPRRLSSLDRPSSRERSPARDLEEPSRPASPAPPYERSLFGAASSFASGALTATAAAAAPAITTGLGAAFGAAGAVGTHVGNPLLWPTSAITLPISVGLSSTVGAGVGALGGAALGTVGAVHAASHFASSARNVSGWWATPSSEVHAADQLDQLASPQLDTPLRNTLYSALCSVAEGEREGLVHAARSVLSGGLCARRADVLAVRELARLTAAQRGVFAEDPQVARLPREWNSLAEGLRALAPHDADGLRAIAEAAQLLEPMGVSDRFSPLIQLLADREWSDTAEISAAVSGLSWRSRFEQQHFETPMLGAALRVPVASWGELKGHVEKVLDLFGAPEPVLAGFENGLTAPLQHWRELSASLDRLTAAGASPAVLRRAVDLSERERNDVLALIGELRGLSAPHRDALTECYASLFRSARAQISGAISGHSEAQLTAWLNALASIGIEPSGYTSDRAFALLDRSAGELKGITELAPQLGLCELHPSGAMTALEWLAPVPLSQWVELGSIARALGRQGGGSASALRSRLLAASAAERAELCAVADQLELHGEPWATVETVLSLSTADRQRLFSLMELLGEDRRFFLHSLASAPDLVRQLLRGGDLPLEAHRERVEGFLGLGSVSQSQLTGLLTAFEGVGSATAGAVLGHPQPTQLAQELIHYRSSALHPDTVRDAVAYWTELPPGLWPTLRERLAPTHFQPNDTAGLGARLLVELGELVAINSALTTEAFNEENVMAEGRISAAAAAFQTLQAAVRRKPGLKAGLDRIEAQLKSIEESSAFARGPMARVRAGATELENARRTLSGSTAAGDYARSLRDNDAYGSGAVHYGLGEMAGLVWAAIEEHADPGDRENLRHAFPLALARCIEDDGHRVCGVGISQRLIGVLQGYLPDIHIDTTPPGARLSELTRRFGEEHPRPSEGDLATFFRLASAEGRENYAQGTPDAEQFESDLRGYLDMTYDWQPPR